MDAKQVIKSQYGAALAMLRLAVEKCPDGLWASADYQNPFWHVAYHAVFYAHLYLHPSEGDFVAWAKHRPAVRSLAGERQAGAAEPYTQAEVLEYLDLCLAQMPGHVDAVDLAGESGFYWLPFNKLELQFYNIRHIQHHTGELAERLGARGEIEVGWVGKVR